jgi:hypothetical protein
MLGMLYLSTKGRDLMTINERDISALREWIMGYPNFSDAEKGMLIDAMTAAILRYEQKGKSN